MSAKLLNLVAFADDTPSLPLMHRVGNPRSEYFVRVPLPWIQAAGRLPGKACQVGNALYFLSGVGRSCDVRLTQTLCDTFGVDRFAMYRALRQLEAARLVRVQRKRGRLPIVTLLPASAAAEGQP